MPGKKVKERTLLSASLLEGTTTCLAFSCQSPWAWTAASSSPVPSERPAECPGQIEFPAPISYVCVFNPHI